MNEILNTFMSQEIPKKYLDSIEKQRYFVKIARAISRLERSHSVNMWWSFATEALYYIQLGKTLEGALERSKECETMASNWFEAIGFERQVKHLEYIIDSFKGIKEDE